MRTHLTVNTKYNGWDIVAIHHDMDLSVMLGEQIIRVVPGEYQPTYVVATISYISYTCGEWNNGYYTDDSTKACETYIEYVTARMR